MEKVPNFLNLVDDGRWWGNPKMVDCEIKKREMADCERDMRW